jgi:hypothetical protein
MSAFGNKADINGGILRSVTVAFLVKVVPGHKLGPRWPSDHCGNNHQNGSAHSDDEAFPLSLSAGFDPALAAS